MTMSPLLTLHVGQPRAWSTTIQQVLANGDGINYLGFHRNDPDQQWFAAGLTETFDRLLRFSTTRSFEAALTEHRGRLAAALDPRSHNVISAESLSFKALPHDVDTATKLSRVAALTDGLCELQLVLVTRPPVELLRSLHRAFIEWGLGSDYESFLTEILAFADANFVGDLSAEGQMLDLAKHLPEARVHHVHLDGSADDRHAAVVGLLDSTFGHSPSEGELPFAHRSATRDELDAMQAEPPGTRTLHDFLEWHRVRADLAIDQTSWVWRNARARRDRRDRARAVANGSTQSATTISAAAIELEAAIVQRADELTARR